MTIDGILFDLDGTLFDRDTAFQAWLSDEIRACPRRAADEEVLLASWLELDGHGYSDRDALLAMIGQELAWPEQTELERHTRFRNGVVARIRPDPKVLEMLVGLQARLRVGILSNGGSSMQRAKLERLGLEGLVHPILISGEIGCSKPDPAAYHLACAAMGLPPSQVVMVGDHPRNDVLGAVAAGLKSCWLRLGRSWPDDLSPPDWSCAGLGEVVATILP